MSRRQKPTAKSGHGSGAEQIEARPLWRSATMRWSLCSAICLWAAFPPLGFWPLAWIAPVGWLRVVRMPKLDVRRPYAAIYLAAYLHWLLMAQWVRLPHWSAGIGWLFLAAYLAAYLVGFVWLARWLVHRANMSSVVAAPLAWVATEVARSYLFTGFALALLGHSQVSLVPVIQIASVAGAYGVSFLVMLVAAAVEQTGASLLANATARTWWPCVVAACSLACVVGFGYWSVDQSAQGQPEVRVAIVQGSLDTVFGGGDGRVRRAFERYIQMTERATAEGQVDLVIWPESMFQIGIIDYDRQLLDARLYPSDPMTVDEVATYAAMEAAKVVRQFRTHCLVGTDTLHYHERSTDRFNTAAFYDPGGKLVGSYHKMHPVMFGEYVPLGNVMPWLYRLTPMPSGLSPGKQPEAFEVGGVSFVPNICFENTVPQLIRSQLRQLDRDGKNVDVLVTLTNDGWFWGSSLLDVHLACGVFRAVESNRPLLIAANTGFSAHIDRCGRVVHKGPRREDGVILTRVNHSESGLSAYTLYGDWFAGVSCLICAAGVLRGLSSPTEPSKTEVVAA